MAVAAYASLVSLTNFLNNLQNHARFHLLYLNMEQIEILRKRVNILLEFVELHSERKDQAIAGLWREIAKVAFEAEDTINFHVVDQLYMSMRSQGETRDMGLSEDMGTLISSVDFIKKGQWEDTISSHVVDKLHIRSQGETSDDMGLATVSEKIDRVISEVELMKKVLLAYKEDKGDVQVGKPASVLVRASGSPTASSKAKDVVVGIHKDVTLILDKLTRSQSKKLQILPIVGMAGIGKTTLAKTIFDHPTNAYHYDIRIWLTISQKSSEEGILPELLDKLGNKRTCASQGELGAILHQKLFNRRYLIVMDDVWTTQVLDGLKTFFPDNENRSCILLTTRLSNVAADLVPDKHYSVNFVNENDSWKLFCRKTFGQIGCPYAELKKIGKDIAKSCRGLPLKIVIISRILATSKMTREIWEFVAKDPRLFGNLEYPYLETVSLSYDNLPIYLKPCFLQMRVFREYSIYVPDLINIWIAEGFIKPINDKSLEEIACRYIKDLIDRNLIFSVDAEKCGNLLQDLCEVQFNNEHFIRSPRVQRFVSHPEKGTCFLCSDLSTIKECIHLPNLDHTFASSSQINPLVCDACRIMYSRIAKPRLVRAIDVFHNDFWEEIVHPTELRYASIAFFEDLKFVCPSKLCLLWNLQILKIKSSNSSCIVLPCEIWKMPQLRVIRVPSGASLVDPATTHTEPKDFLVLNNLQSLSRVLNLKCSKKILDRIPNLKNLEISLTNESGHCPCNLEQLLRLESLLVQGALKRITFPNSLKRLSLLNCRMAWEEMSILGSLLSLERLELNGGMEGSEWHPVEGEFQQLKELLIQSTDLVYWRAEAIHFPILQRLEFCELYSLDEIPSDIGDIHTLQLIKVTRCKASVFDSAMQIRKDQRDLGNMDLQIVAYERSYSISDDNHES